MFSILNEILQLPSIYFQIAEIGSTFFVTLRSDEINTWANTPNKNSRFAVKAFENWRFSETEQFLVLDELPAGFPWDRNT